MGTDAISAAVKPDPTKWRDRIFEVATGAAFLGVLVAVVSGAASFAAVFLGAYNFAAAAGFGSSIAALLSAAGLATVYSSTHHIVQARPAWRKLGITVPAIAAIAATAGGSAYIHGPSPTAAPRPVSTSPETVFNITARNDALPQAQKPIRVDGLRVAYAKPPAP